MHWRRNLDRERSASEIVSYGARVEAICLRPYPLYVFYLLSNSGEPVHAIRDVFICAQTSIKLPKHLLKHSSLSQKSLKPSLGNNNVHRRRNLDTEPSASEILRDRDSFGLIYCFIYVSRSRWRKYVHGVANPRIEYAYG